MQPQLPHQQKNRRIKRLHKRKTGLPPGTLLYTGEKKSSEITVHRIAYNTTNYAEKIFTDGNKLNLEVPEDSVLWLNINGLHNEKFIESIGNHFGLHNLILEDILNVFQIPKAEEYPETDQFYITLNEFYIDDQGKLNRDQISLLLGKGYLLSFQEEEGDYFEQIRERLRTAKGKLRKKHADYLLYVLLDSIVDSYYIILDQYSGQIDVVEDSIFEKKNTNHLETIHQLNKDMIFLPIETSGEGDVNAHSRVQMALGEAKAKAKIEYRECLENCGYTLEELKAYVDANEELQKPFFKISHRKGISGLGANFILDVSEMMKKDGIKTIGVVGDQKSLHKVVRFP